MAKTIEDFADTLPRLTGLDEAKRLYGEAKNLDDFPRVELDGAYTTSRIGIQMVYVIGRGKTNYHTSSDEVEAIFYFSRFITGDFFESVRDPVGEVEAIPLERINRITILPHMPEVYESEKR